MIVPTCRNPLASRRWLINCGSPGEDLHIVPRNPKVHFMSGSPFISLCSMPLLIVTYSLQPPLAICLPQTESSWLLTTAMPSRQLTSHAQIAQLLFGSGSSRRSFLSSSFMIVINLTSLAQNPGRGSIFRIRYLSYPSQPRSCWRSVSQR